MVRAFVYFLQENWSPLDLLKMWIQVRSFDGKKSLQVDNLSKLTKIEELRARLVDEFDAPVEKQRLFYRGKQVGLIE